LRLELCAGVEFDVISVSVSISISNADLGLFVIKIDI